MVVLYKETSITHLFRKLVLVKAFKEESARILKHIRLYQKHVFY